jgi:hypothetical protein
MSEDYRIIAEVELFRHKHRVVLAVPADWYLPPTLTSCYWLRLVQIFYEMDQQRFPIKIRLESDGEPIVIEGKQLMLVECEEVQFKKYIPLAQRVYEFVDSLRATLKPQTS